ncbi:MAG TPA: hypothetical protein VF017_06855 [Thermoanaerobaculia bacterium]|nr:hypothetical protein [Thermoanaerobaculia bacterium]
MALFQHLLTWLGLLDFLKAGAELDPHGQPLAPSGAGLGWITEPTG